MKKHRQADDVLEKHTASSSSSATGDDDDDDDDELDTGLSLVDDEALALKLLTS